MTMGIPTHTTSSATGASGLSPLPPAAAPGSGPRPLLPPPSSAVNVDDALSVLFKLSSQMNESQSTIARSQANQAAAARDKASSQRRELLEQAVEAAKKAAEARDDGGFFDCITDNLGPVGLVGMVIGAAYLVAADVTMHATGLENESFDVADAGGLGCMLYSPLGTLVYAAELCAKELGPDELSRALEDFGTIRDEDVATANKIAFTVMQAEYAIAATVASGGTTAPAVIAMTGISLSTATQMAEQTKLLQEIFGEDAKWAALAGGVAGAACGLTGGIWLMAAGNVKSLGDLANAAEKVRLATEATHNVNQGIHNLRAAGYQRDADRLQSDAKEQRHMTEFLERMIDSVIDDLRGLRASQEKTTQLCTEMGQIRNNTLLIAANLKG